MMVIKDIIKKSSLRLSVFIEITSKKSKNNYKYDILNRTIF
jgi:hypothetical protein